MRETKGSLKIAGEATLFVLQLNIVPEGGASRLFGFASHLPSQMTIKKNEL